MKKYFIVFLILIYIFSIHQVFAESLNVTGFIPGSIWYSKEPLVAGDTVKIYTALWNGEKTPISFRIEFYDKNIILGSRDIVILPEQIKDVSISWKVTSGDHIISAKILSSSIDINNNKKSIIFERSETKKENFFIPVVVSNEGGIPLTSSDTIKKQIDKTTSEINNFLPSSISSFVSNNLSLIDEFRNDSFIKVNNAKNETKKEIDLLNKKININNEISLEEKTELSSNADYTGIKSSEFIQKPIAQIKLFLLTIISFILSYKVLFYAVSLFIAFYILRFIYHRIRNR